MLEVLDLAFAHAGRAARGGRPPLVALSGAQGSGKSTLARTYVDAHPGVASLSLDDFYLGKTARALLARRVHPLLETRGVPGTHDLRLLGDVIAALAVAGPSAETRIPEFDKLADDRRPFAHWRVFRGRPDAILIEGWCLGALPETEAALAVPVNALERERDRNGRWRRCANDRLGDSYAALFAGFDALAWLRAPGFAHIARWRSQQQETLLDRALSQAEEAEIAGFVAHFERITRHMLDGGIRADVVADVGPDRSLLSLRFAGGGTSAP